MIILFEIQRLGMAPKETVVSASGGPIPRKTKGLAEQRKRKVTKRKEGNWRRLWTQSWVTHAGVGLVSTNGTGTLGLPSTVYVWEESVGYNQGSVGRRWSKDWFYVAGRRLSGKFFGDSTVSQVAGGGALLLVNPRATRFWDACVMLGKRLNHPKSTTS